MPPEPPHRSLVLPEPRPETLAEAQWLILSLRGFRQKGGLLALTADGDVGQVAAGAALVHPQISRALVLGAVHEDPPVDVAHVASDAGLDKSYRHHFSELPIGVSPHDLLESVPVHERPGTNARSGVLHLVLCDKPFGEQPGGNSRNVGVRIVDVGGGAKILQTAIREASSPSRRADPLGSAVACSHSNDPVLR